jgi:hypothetical protein
MSAAEWRYLRVTLLGPEEADDPEALHRCDHRLLHVSKCEELFPTEPRRRSAATRSTFQSPL